MAGNLITDRHIRSAQRLNERLMPDVAQVLIPVSATDSTGARAVTWPESGESVKCRKSRYGKDPDVEAGGQPQNLQLWLFTFPAGTVIEPNYRLLCNGVTYTVVSDPKAPSFEIGKRILARAI